MKETYTLMYIYNDWVCHLLNDFNWMYLLKHMEIVLNKNVREHPIKKHGVKWHHWKKLNLTCTIRQTAENERWSKWPTAIKIKTSTFHQVDHLDHFKIVEKAVRMKNMLTIYNRGSKLIRERRRGWIYILPARWEC